MWSNGAARWALSILAFATATGPAEASVRLRLAPGGLPIVPVSINGSGPHDFLLDTGASCTLIDDRLRRTLGLAPLAETRLSTVKGGRAADRVRVESLSIGPVRVQNLLAVSTDLEWIRSQDRRVSGVLGYDVLSKHAFLLDYGAKTVSFEAGERLRGVPVRYDDSGRRIRLTLGALRLVLDTAATKMVLFQAKSGAHGTEVRHDSRSLSRISAVDGFRLVRTGTVRELAAGDRVLRDLPVVLVPRNEVPEGLSEDGLLPARLFARIFVDPEERYVILDPSDAGSPGEEHQKVSQDQR